MAVLLTLLAFGAFACLCAALCIYLCMRRKLAGPATYGPTYAEKSGPPENKWIGWIPPDAKEEPFWWHGASDETSGEDHTFNHTASELLPEAFTPLTLKEQSPLVHAAVDMQFARTPVTNPAALAGVQPTLHTLPHIETPMESYSPPGFPLRPSVVPPGDVGAWAQRFR